MAGLVLEQWGRGVCWRAWGWGGVSGVGAGGGK